MRKKGTKIEKQIVLCICYCICLLLVSDISVLIIVKMHKIAKIKFPMEIHREYRRLLVPPTRIELVSKP